MINIFISIVHPAYLPKAYKNKAGVLCQSFEIFLICNAAFSFRNLSVIIFGNHGIVVGEARANLNDQYLYLHSSPGLFAEGVKK